MAFTCTRLEDTKCLSGFVTHMHSLYVAHCTVSWLPKCWPKGAYVSVLAPLWLIYILNFRVQYFGNQPTVATIHCVISIVWYVERSIADIYDWGAIFTEVWSAEVNMHDEVGYIEAMDRPTILYIIYSMVSVQQTNLFVCDSRTFPQRRHFLLRGPYHIYIWDLLAMLNFLWLRNHKTIQDDIS